MNHDFEDNKPVTKKVLMETLIEFWERVVSPELDKKADKEDILRVEKNLNILRVETSNNFRNLDRRVVDHELDSPAKEEFVRLEKRVSVLESQHKN